MNTSHPKIYFLIFLLLSNFSHGGVKNVGGVVGSIRKSIAAGSPTAPVYSVSSASVVSDSVYSGQILNVNSTGVTFEASSDESETAINPFITGVFHKSNRTPILTSSLSGGAVGSISITYPGIGFSTAPEIIIDYPSDGDDQATATCTLSSTGIGSVSITNAGSGYSNAPIVTVIGGPHLLKISESGDTNEGMFFRIRDNNSTGLVLDTSRLPSGDSLADYLSADLSVEVVAAPTIASVMGRTASSLPTNFNPSNSYGSSNGADLIYLFNRTVYEPYCFMPQSGSNIAAWYSPSSMRRGHRNDVIIYPDEGFIISKCTSGALDIDFDGGAKTSSQKMKLPNSNRAACMNNPYGTDMLLGEIIPPKLIGSGNSKFNTGSSDTDADADILYFLVGTEWKQFYYKTGVNHGVTRNATATARAGTGGSGALADVDVSLAGGAVSNLQSCNSAGSTSIDHNISEYTKVTLTGTAPAVGFNIEFSGFFGRKLDGLGNGTHEVDINGTRVNQGSGIFFRSGLNGTYKVIARPSSSSVVVKKKRDIHFVGGKGSGPKWSTGQGGAGYNGNAKAYFMGGGNTTMAIATATVSSGAVTGFSFSGTGNTRGAGYTYAPQVVICSGGWRKVGAANPNNVIQDGQVLDATEGIVIIRKGTTRTLTYFQPKNPFN